MKTSPEELWLENQICFPLYATSRLVTQLYTPLLASMDLTYPQYLVMLVLWQQDKRTVSKITHLLQLETNTITPLLKRLESKGLINRERQKDDERIVLISLTASGQELQKQAECIPEKIVAGFESDQITKEEVIQLKQTLHKIMRLFGDISGS